MGSFTVKVLPFASSLCTSMVPPCLSTSILLRASPKPDPFALVAKSASPPYSPVLLSLLPHLRVTWCPQLDSFSASLSTGRPAPHVPSGSATLGSCGRRDQPTSSPVYYHSALWSGARAVSLRIPPCRVSVFHALSWQKSCAWSVGER